IGQGAIGCAKINADQIPRHHCSKANSACTLAASRYLPPGLLFSLEGTPMSPLRRFCVSLFALLMLAQGGCLLVGAAAVGGGATGLAIYSGTATQTFDASLAQVATATQSALQDLGLPVEPPHIGEFHCELYSTLDAG